MVGSGASGGVGTNRRAHRCQCEPLKGGRQAGPPKRIAEGGKAAHIAKIRRRSGAARPPLAPRSDIARAPLGRRAPHGRVVGNKVRPPSLCPLISGVAGRVPGRGRHRSGPPLTASAAEAGQRPRRSCGVAASRRPLSTCVVRDCSASRHRQLRLLCRFGMRPPARAPRSRPHGLLAQRGARLPPKRRHGHCAPEA